MKIKYTGTPGEQHDGLMMYGQYFPLWKAVTVSDPLAIRKLSAHPHFDAKAEPADEVEDAQVKREFEAVTNAALVPVEEAHVAEAETIAALTDEEKYGSDPEPVGDSDASEAASDRGERKRGPGRPRKGS